MRGSRAVGARGAAPARWLAPLADALERAPAPVTVFVRDDDAGVGDEQLVALLDRFDAQGLPIDLAVIPTMLRPELARLLLERRERAGGRLALHQHGFAHRNHEPEGRDCEFGPARAHAEQLHDIAEGRRILDELLPGATLPIFTPPWNRCTRTTGECLAELGFAVLSREWRADGLDVPGLRELPIRVDWSAKKKGVPLGRAAVGEQLAEAVRAGGPLGLMLHHEWLDAAELEALDELLSVLARHERVRPVGMAEAAGIAA